MRPLLDHMRAAGLDVWGDEGIAPSMQWRAEIARQLNAAKCVVAVWTAASVDPDQGQWVMEEASHGLARRALAPVRMDPVAPPLGFGEVQFADLAAWSGGADDPRLQHFLAVVQAIVRQEPLTVRPTPTSFEAPGIKMSDGRMQNVSICVVQGADGADGDELTVRAPRLRAERRPFSFSGLIASFIGILFPLVGIWIFVTSMRRMRCDQGAAPASFCSWLDGMQAANAEGQVARHP